MPRNKRSGIRSVRPRIIGRRKGIAAQRLAASFEALEVRRLLDGSGLLGSYYDNMNLSGNPTGTRVDGPINFNWASGVSPMPGVGPDQFSVRWTGQIQPAVTQTYTFTTISNDGVRVWVNGEELINHWNSHPADTDSGSITLVAGEHYNIEMDYFQNQLSATAVLEWAGPGQTAQPIPAQYLYPQTASQPANTPTQASATVTSGGNVSLSWSDNSSGQDGAIIQRSIDGVNFTTIAELGDNQSPYTDTTVSAGSTYYYQVIATGSAGQSTPSSVIGPITTPGGVVNSANGLLGVYYDNANFTSPTPVAEVDPQVNFDWNSGSPTAGIGSSNYSVQWTGQLVAPVGGSYSIGTTSDDGVRMWLGPAEIINDFADHSLTVDSAQVSLVAGQKYNVVLQYFNDDDAPGVVQLAWTVPGGALSIIPTTQLLPSLLIAPTPIPEAPISLTATGASGQVTLSWPAVAGASSYDIYRGTASGGESVTPFQTGVTTTGFADTAITAGVSYFYEVTAVNSAGQSSVSPEASASIPVPLFPVPAAPTGLTAKASLDPTVLSVGLSWSDVSGETGFVISRSTDGVNFSVIGTTAAGVTTYADNGVLVGTTYYYEVAAANANGDSLASNIASTTTMPGSLAAPLQAPVSLVATTASNGDIRLTWPAVAGASNYAVYRGTVSGGESVVPFQTGVNGTLYINGGAKPGVTYYYTVRAMNSLAQSNYSPEASAMVPTAAPTAPASLIATGSTGQVSLSWASAATASSYNIYRGTVGGGESVTPLQSGITGTSFIDTAVVAGTKYFYEVTAVNSGGQSADSPEASATVPVPAPILPGTPGSLTASYSGGQVNLSWAAVSAASSYDIYRGTASGGESVTPFQAGVTGTSFADTAVTAGTKYFYEVTAVNGAGQSSVSPEASAMVPIPVPGAPASLTATAGIGQVTLVWAGVSTAGSYDIYRGTVSGGESSISLQTGVTGTTFIDSAVTAGTKYFYEVTAVDGGGQSSDSPEASATVPIPVPSAPSSLTATPATGQVTLAWTAVSAAGSYDIYRGTASGGESSTPLQTGVTGTTFIDSAVTAGTNYFYEITAVDGGGQSSDSPEASAMVPIPVPSAPTLLTATPATGQVTLVWSAVSAASSYDIYRGTVSGGESSIPLQTGMTGTTFIDSAVTAGTKYFYEVTAVDSAGQSSVSPEASAMVPIPPPVPPAAPASLSATPATGQVTLVWSAVSTASSYDIYRGTASGGESSIPLQTGVTGTTFIDSAVTAGTQYFYEVTAVNGGGQSSFSPEASATVPVPAPIPPVAPATLRAIPSTGQIGLSWSAVLTASSYDIYRGTVSGGESVTPWQAGITATNFSDTTAIAGTKYFYEVTAVNGGGQSSVSPEASATVPIAAPSAPGSLTATPASGQVTLVWSAVSAATSYDIYRGTVSGGESATPFQVGITGTSFTDSSVTAGSSYFYEVTALNNGGQSGDSPEASATLAVPIPAMPAGVTATATSASTISVSWLDESYEAGFQVLESTDGVNYSAITSTGTGVTSYLVSGLSPGTTYDFEIVATNASGNSPASSPASATTPSSTSGFYGLTATAQPGENLLAWPAQFGATSYNIFRGTSSGGESGTPIQSVLKGPFTDTTASAGVTYYYTVEAVVSGGQAELSSEVSATPLAPAPAAPTTLLASALPDGILLNWSAVSGATSYDIFRGLSSGNEAATPYEMGLTTTSFVDTAVSGAGTYYYVVAGVNASGQGSASAEVSGSAPNVTGMPAPAGLFATANSTADITVSWQDVPGETGFEVLRSTDDINFSQITTVGSGITNYADSGLNAGTTYYYEVVALNGGVASAASASTSATTQTAFDYTNEPAPQPSDGWTTSDPSNLITPTTTQPNNIFYVGMPVTFQLGNTAVSYQVRDYYGNLVDQGTAQPSTTVNVSKAGWYKLYVYGADTSAQFGNIIGTTTFVIFPNNPNSTPLTDLYQGNYYFIDPAMTRVDPTINFNWTNTAPTASMPLTYYGVEWTGQIQAQATQTYVFSTTSDDGVRLWVNGQELINDWTPHGATNDFGSIALVAGQRYDIKVEYYQDLYAAQISLSWSSTTSPGQIIPASVLYPTDSSTTPGGLTGNYYIGLTSNDPSEDTVVHDVTGMGPERLNITDPSDPTTAIASIEADIATDDALYVGKDAERPTGLLVSFTNGTSDLTDIKTIVTALQGQVEYWEGQNEPDTGAYSGAGYVPVEEAFYNTVKSVNPNLQVLGPAAVSIADDGAGLPWIQDFLAAGGGQYIDGLSFHGYDTNQGSLYQLREALTGITSLLAQYGLQNLPLWQTEQGYPTAIYGSYQPEIQGQWTMLQMMAYEQFGIPKEHNVLWYDDSDGYWDIPDFWQSDDGSLLPAAALMNSWSQQLYGTTYTEAYNFGSANNLYIGSLFTGPGKSVAAFMAAGQSNGTITLNVQGGTSLDVVDAFGNETAVPVVNGQVTLSVPEEPVYVDMTPGQTINVVQDSWGPDVALQSGTTASYSGSSASNSGISQIINGVQENWYWNGDAPWGTVDDTDQGANIQITLPQEETLSQVTIFAMPPWQDQGTLMDFDLQYFDSSNGQWETLDHVVQQADTFGVFTPVDRTTVDSYFDNQYIFQNAFSPVTTQQIRLVINSVSYGGGATQLVPESGGQASPTPTLTISEVEIFG